ncbi:MAG TPA: HAD hydrolase-like protein [Candidatus Paceibacterota bacterium]|nr:HAD hydrolase-like protein [Candidatus Paceibacterota bacterium]
MKLIFDFDDTLFRTTPLFKERMFSVLEAEGIPRIQSETLYKEMRVKEFSLMDYIGKFFTDEKKKVELYQRIMETCSDLVNEELMSVVVATGKENCYIVTNGEQEFQLEKIEMSGIAPFFEEIIVVSGSKKEVIEKICQEFPDEKVIFVENREIFLSDLDIGKLPNLKTVPYDKNGFQKLKEAMEG